VRAVPVERLRRDRDPGHRQYIQRQIAQYTGGRFVFLTCKEGSRPASGPGSQTWHDVANYSAQTLDRLIVRLVSEELGKLPAGG
jgi:hypothetical protein